MGAVSKKHQITMAKHLSLLVAILFFYCVSAKTLPNSGGFNWTTSYHIITTSDYNMTTSDYNMTTLPYGDSTAYTHGDSTTYPSGESTTLPSGKSTTLP